MGAAPPPPQLCSPSSLLTPPPHIVPPPQAELWLSARAREEGWRRAERLRERRAQEGLLGVLQVGHCAVLLEVGPGGGVGGEGGDRVPLFLSF